jgi:hypothetical protein
MGFDPEPDEAAHHLLRGDALPLLRGEVLVPAFEDLLLPPGVDEIEELFLSAEPPVEGAYRGAPPLGELENGNPLEGLLQEKSFAGLDEAVERLLASRLTGFFDQRSPR